MKNILIISLIVAFLTSFPALPVRAQEVVEAGREIELTQYYGGVETTNFGVYDPEAGVWVQVPASRLPWWWTPPPDWVLWSTLGIATAAVVMSAVFIGEGLSFGSVVIHDHHYRGRLGHFHHFRDRVVGPHFKDHYRHARGAAEKRYPGGLKHPPGPRGPAGPGPGRVGPPPKAGVSGPGGIGRTQGAPPRAAQPRSTHQTRPQQQQMRQPRPAQPRPAQNRPAPQKKNPNQK